MIRRQSSQSDQLITQDDHAALAADLLQHWGNSRFHRPQSPTATWDAVILAARLHDAGWPLHDSAPTLNPAGRPLDVFETARAVALPVWSASAERAAAAHPYAGLLTSLHVLTLSADLIRTDPQLQSAARNPAAPDLAAAFALNKFQHREIERQEQLRQSLHLVATGPLTLGLAPPGASPAEDLLRLHLRALQAVDFLSLGLCCTHPPARQSRPVHASLGSPEIVLEGRRAPDDTLLVRPWPLDVPQLRLTIPTRRLPPQRWDSDATFRAAYAAAPTEPLPLTLAAEK